MAIPVKIFDVISKYERDVLDQYNRYLEYVESDTARLQRLHENNRLSPVEVLEIDRPWWKFWAKSERIELEPKPLAESQYQKLLRERRHIQKLQFACEGVLEADLPYLAFTRDFAYRVMRSEWNERHFFFYRPVIEWNGATVELSHVLVGPTHLYIVEWLEGDRSIYHISKEKTWVHQPLKGENTRVVNPLIALTRTEELVRQIVPNYAGVLQKVVIAADGYFDNVPSVRTTHYVGRNEYREWMKQVNGRAPIVKAQQVRDVATLLEVTAKMPIRQFMDQ